MNYFCRIWVGDAQSLQSSLARAFTNVRGFLGDELLSHRRNVARFSVLYGYQFLLDHTFTARMLHALIILQKTSSLYSFDKDQGTIRQLSRRAHERIFPCQLHTWSLPFQGQTLSILHILTICTFYFLLLRSLQ